MMEKRVHEIDSLWRKVVSVDLDHSREDWVAVFLQIFDELRNFDWEQHIAEHVHIGQRSSNVANIAHLFDPELRILIQKVINFMLLSRVD
jgi:hypothetical protein